MLPVGSEAARLLDSPGRSSRVLGPSVLTTPGSRASLTGLSGSRSWIRPGQPGAISFRARDQINDDSVSWASYQQVDKRRDPPAPGERRPVISADQATASLQVEAGPGPQRY